MPKDALLVKIEEQIKTAEAQLVIALDRFALLEEAGEASAELRDQLADAEVRIARWKQVIASRNGTTPS